MNVHCPRDPLTCHCDYHSGRVDAPPRPEVVEALKQHEKVAQGIMLVGADVDVTEEHTSARIASLAAKLLGSPNILMRASPYHPAVLKAIQDNTKDGVTGQMLDLLEALARAIEPFMRDVRAVAGSALTQVVVLERAADDQHEDDIRP